MTLDQLIDVANAGYSDDVVLQYHQEPDGPHGDGLAKFIAIELAETFDEALSDELQLTEALRAMTNARDDLECVIDELEAARLRKRMG